MSDPQRNVDIAIIGMSCRFPGAASAEEVDGNVALMRAPIPPALWADLKARGLVHPEAPVPDVTGR